MNDEYVEVYFWPDNTWCYKEDLELFLSQNREYSMDDALLEELSEYEFDDWLRQH